MGLTTRLVAVALLALALPADAADPTPRPGAIEVGEREFLEQHWRRAIPPQGPAPARFSPIERLLQPEACGACHPVQFVDWQASLHSKSMGKEHGAGRGQLARGNGAAEARCRAIMLALPRAHCRAAA
jgi:hypothetical protein